MTDKARKDVARGSRAKALLENELLKETLDRMEQRILESWKNSHSEDDEIRHNAYLMQRLLCEFRDYLTRTVANGEKAGKELNLKVKDSKIKRYL